MYINKQQEITAPWLCLLRLAVFGSNACCNQNHHPCLPLGLQVTLTWETFVHIRLKKSYILQKKSKLRVIEYLVDSLDACFSLNFLVWNIVLLSFNARTYLQLPLWQYGADNVYLLVLSSWKVNIAETSLL